MSSARFRRTIAGLLSGLAYLACALQWLWVMMIAIPPLAKKGAFDSVMNDQAETAPMFHIEPIVMTPLVGFIVGMVTIVMIALSVYLVIRLPKTVAQASEVVVKRATQAVEPMVTHHKPLPVKKRREITLRIKLSLQLALAVLPLLVSLFLPAFQQISREIIMIIAVILSAVSMAGFVSAWLLIYNLKPISQTRSHASHGSR